MYKIQANQSGTRSIEVSDQHLRDYRKVSVTSQPRRQQRHYRRGSARQTETQCAFTPRSSDIKDKELLDLCLDVIYNQNMKALGLHNLVLLYVDWKDKKQAEAAADAEPDAVND